VGTHAPLPRALARALVACVVLAGLFLMHGLPGGDCAAQPDGGASSMTSASMMPAPGSIAPASMSYPSMGLMSSPLAQSVEAAEPAVRFSTAGSAAVSGSASVSAIGPSRTGAGMAGGLCVSRQPPIGPGVLALLLVVGVLAFGGLTGRAVPIGRFPRGRGLRAPPLAGAILLVSLCISRT
jgi:hypothetical protein